MKKKNLRSWISRVLVLVMLLSLLAPGIRVSAAEPELSAGQINIVKRARQMTSIRWTPQQDIYGWNKELTYKSGTTYTGLPYGQPVNASYVPWQTGLDGFLEAVNDPESLMYTSYSAYNKRAPYYSIDCSAFVSWAWNLSSRQTTSSLVKYTKLISTDSYEQAQVGDCLNKSGSHVVLITDIGYDANGKINSIEISEATTNATTHYCCQVTRYGVGGKYTLERFQTKYFGGGYLLCRSLTRDAVTYKHSCAAPLEGDVCEKCGVGGYLTQCRRYCSAVELTVGEQCQVYGLPRAEGEPVQTLYRGSVLTASGLYQNPDGEYWYAVKLDDGSLGYIFSGHAEQTGVAAPWVEGGSFPTAIAGSTSLVGVVNAGGALLDTVQAQVCRRDSGSVVLKSGVAQVGAEEFSLRSSTVDKTTVFSKLSTYGTGYYTLKITAGFTSYYVDGGALKQVQATADAALYDFYYGSTSGTHVTVSFRPEGGSCARVTRVMAPGSALGALPVPSRNGFDFVGWYTAREGGEAVGPETTLAANTTLYARWTPMTFAVTYDVGGGSDAPDAQVKVYGEALKLSEQVPVRKGHAFLGWAAEGDVPQYQPGESYFDNLPLNLCALWQRTEPETVASGFSGQTQWALTDDGVLTFTGDGTMKHYSYKTEMPWYKHYDKITAVVISEGVTSIGDYAFYGAPALESIEIASTVTAIGDYAFKNAPSLRDVVLPQGLTSLGDSAFYACTALESIEIPASLWTVKPYTFKNCTGLKSVVFHEGNLMKISDGAFYGTGLTEVKLPDCLDILDSYAFKGCADLERIELGTGLTELREAVFYGTAAAELQIPEGITKIGPYAFKNCVNLEEVALPASLGSVGEAAFYACTGLKAVALPDAVETIGDYAFRKCEAVALLTLGQGLKTIGECAFYGCYGLTELTIPDQVVAIEPYAFKTCTGLRDLTLGENLAVIGESAFNTCTSLEAVAFPESVTTIGPYCFSGSTNLWELTFLGDAPAIGTGAFKGLDGYACYPAGNSTWTSAVRQNYGGTIVWMAR